MKYDVIIIGAGPGGIFSAYELMEQNKDLKIAVFEEGNPLNKRHCPIDGKKVKTCIKCKTCSIMSGFGGAGAFSDFVKIFIRLKLSAWCYSGCFFCKSCHSVSYSSLS